MIGTIALGRVDLGVKLFYMNYMWARSRAGERFAAHRVRALDNNRRLHLILENEDNQADLLARDAGMQPQWYTAQWNDDVHHVLHTATTGERNGYYVDYHGSTRKLGRALAEGFAFQGERMVCRPKERGQPSAHLPPEALVSFLQNHDQIGNRALVTEFPLSLQKKHSAQLAVFYLLLPHIPMLFMGQEWNAAQPFPFFSDFSGKLGEKVRQGRREEFSDFPEFQDSRHMIKCRTLNQRQPLEQPNLSGPSETSQEMQCGLIGTNEY
jgi:maltooligosyltrehalose trehalohydrolase